MIERNRFNVNAKLANTWLISATIEIGLNRACRTATVVTDRVVVVAFFLLINHNTISTNCLTFWKDIILPIKNLFVTNSTNTLFGLLIHDKV